MKARRRARDDDTTVWQRQRAFSHAPAALRIFRFAADSAPRLLELAHVSAFLRECAVEFGSADATLPGALRCEYAAGRFFELRTAVLRNAARCPWLAEKLLACRSGAPMPAAALARDVMRHDVNWGAEGARRNADLQLTHGGFGLSGCDSDDSKIAAPENVHPCLVGCLRQCRWRPRQGSRRFTGACALPATGGACWALTPRRAPPTTTSGGASTWATAQRARHQTRGN
jgi:hypothetical protein